MPASHYLYVKLSYYNLNYRPCHRKYVSTEENIKKKVLGSHASHLKPEAATISARTDVREPGPPFNIESIPLNYRLLETMPASIWQKEETISGPIIIKSLPPSQV